MAETIDLTFLGKQTEKALAELQKLRRELADVRTLTLQSVEYNRRLERNSHELKDDLELLLKSEIMGRLGNFETRVEQTINEKFDELREELPRLIADAVRQVLAERGS